MKHKWSKMLIILSVAGACGNNSYAAPIQWTTASGGNNHWYEIVVTDSHTLIPNNLNNLATGINFNDAKAEAIAKGGYLATPDTKGEATFIYDHLVQPAANGRGLQGYWLGVYNSGQSQAWQWVTGDMVPSSPAWGWNTYIDWAGTYTYIDWYEGNVPYAIGLFANNPWGGYPALGDWTQTGKANGYVVEYLNNPSMEITNILLDPTSTQITINGTHLVGTAGATVKMDGQPLTILTQTPTTLVAVCPGSPSYCKPGDWSLSVSSYDSIAGSANTRLVDQIAWNFTVGAVGPQGPKGDKGDKGDSGKPSIPVFKCPVVNITNPSQASFCVGQISTESKCSVFSSANNRVATTYTCGSVGVLLVQ